MIRFLRLGLLLLATAAPLSAQDWAGRGRAQGSLKDPDGKPIAGAKVILALAESGQGPSTTSDKSGRWALGGLRAGKWNVDIEAAGFVGAKRSIEIQEFGFGPKVDLKLDRVAAAPPPSEPDQRSVELKAMLQAGDQAFQAGQYAAARAEYDKVAALRPEILELQRSIAYCFYKEGNLAEAAARLKVIVEKDPGKQENVVLLANILLEQGDLDEGLAALGKIDPAQVSSPDTWYNVGILLLNKARAADSIGYFDKTLALDAAYADAWYSRGLAKVQANRNAEAKADLQRYLTLAPADARNAATARELLKALK